MTDFGASMAAWLSFAPPGVALIVTGLLLFFVRRAAWRQALLFVTPPLVLFLIWQEPIATATVGLWGLELAAYEPTVLGRLFATAFVLTLFVGNLYALRVAGITESGAAQIYGGSAICVALVGDFLSLFLFWEIAAVGSAAIVFAGGSAAARGAMRRYIFMHLLSGTMMLVGIVGLAVHTGDVSLRALPTEQWYVWCLLVGVLINAGAPPFSAWIADAYPEASASGMVYLSAYSTKAAVYLLLVVFAGEAILIPLGVFMIFYGLVYALLENNMRRLLAYGIVTQVGFMVVATGIGTEMAISGAAAHAFVHIIYKALLLMSTGSVIFVTGLHRCSELGGLFRSMPWTTACAVIGAATLLSAPFTSGYIAKVLVAAAALDSGMAWLWLLFTAAGAGMVLHAGVVWFAFFQRAPRKQVDEAPLSMRVAMGLFALACVALGAAPQWLYAHLPFAVTYEPYTTKHMVAQLQLVVAAVIAFFALLPLMRRTATISLDFDWFYRKPGLMLARFVVRSAQRIGAWVGERASDCATGMMRVATRARIVPSTRNTVSLLMVVFAFLLAVVLFRAA